MIIDLKKLEHVKEKSVYNYNFYRKKDSNIGTMIRIEHTDDSHEVDVYIVHEDVEIFLGSAEDKDTGVFDVALGEYYT